MTTITIEREDNWFVITDEETGVLIHGRKLQDGRRMEVLRQGFELRQDVPGLRLA